MKVSSWLLLLFLTFRVFSKEYTESELPHTQHTAGILINTSKLDKEDQLIYKGEGNICLFVDNQLDRCLSKKDTFSFQALRKEKEVLICGIGEADISQLMIIKERQLIGTQLFVPRTPPTIFSATKVSFLLVLCLLVICIEAFSPSSLLSVIGIPFFYMAQKFSLISVWNVLLLFMAIICTTLLLDEYKWSEGVTSTSWNMVYYAILTLSFYGLKMLLTFFLGDIVGEANTAKQHNAEFSKFFIFFNVVLYLALVLLEIYHLDITFWLFEIYIFLLLLWVLHIVVLIQRVGGFQKMYFFSYICTLEIAPVLIFLVWL